VSAGDWTVWSWDARNRMWMEIARGPEGLAADIFSRQQRAAAKHLPSARFALCEPGEEPHEPPQDGAK
jgi:hypothetical protein